MEELNNLSAFQSETTDGISVSTEFSNESHNRESKLEQLREKIVKNWDQCGTSYLTIGKNLLEARKLFGKHGEWQKWLRENIPFSIRQAERLIRVAEWFGDATSVSYIGFAKAYILTRLPKKKLKDFLKHYGMDGADSEQLSAIHDMSKRELEKAIREYLSSQSTVPHTCKEEKVPATSSVDGVLDTLVHWEKTISGLVENIIKRQVDDEVYDTLVPEIRRICEDTLIKLPSEEVVCE